jgi:hypothetical protein
VTLPRKPAAPAPGRAAGLIVAVQGAAALVVAAVLLVRALAGADQRVVNGSPASGWYPQGTMAFFVLVGVVVLAAGRALTTGRRWGRGLAVITQLLLLPVAWYLVRGSQQAAAGIAAGAVAVAVLVLLFTPAAVRWAAGGDQDGPGGPARAANRSPESR